ATTVLYENSSVGSRVMSLSEQRNAARTPKPSAVEKLMILNRSRSFFDSAFIVANGVIRTLQSTASGPNITQPAARATRQPASAVTNNALSVTPLTSATYNAAGATRCPDHQAAFPPSGSFWGRWAVRCGGPPICAFPRGHPQTSRASCRCDSCPV